MIKTSCYDRVSIQYCGVTIYRKATAQYFPVVLFCMLYKVVPNLSLWMKFQSVTIQMKATAQYFPVVLFRMLYKVVPNLKF